jgi:hypothetical protein
MSTKKEWELSLLFKEELSEFSIEGVSPSISKVKQDISTVDRTP